MFLSAQKFRIEETNVPRGTKAVTLTPRRKWNGAKIIIRTILLKYAHMLGRKIYDIIS